MAGNRTTNWTNKVNGKEYKRYRTSLVIGHDERGKAIRKWFTAPTKTEALAAKKKYKNEINSGVDPKLGDVDLSSAMGNWIYNVKAKSDIKRSSFERYETIYRLYIQNRKPIGFKKIKYIKQDDFDDYLAQLRDKGIAVKNPDGSEKTVEVSYNTRKDIAKVCSIFFTYLIKREIISRNPLFQYTVIKSEEEKIAAIGKRVGKDREIKTFSLEEISQLMKAFEDPESVENTKRYLNYWDNVRAYNRNLMSFLVPFAYHTGARIGEILALNESDIKEDKVDIYKSVRRVKKSLSRQEHEELKQKKRELSDEIGALRRRLKLKGLTDEEIVNIKIKLEEMVGERDNASLSEVRVTVPKTKESIRENPLPKSLMKVLHKLNTFLKTHRLAMGEDYVNKGLLFPNFNGDYLDSTIVGRLFKEEQEALGMEYRNFHCLRHSYATNLLERGESDYNVKKLLGHSSTATTEIYSHSTEKIKREAVSVLDDMDFYS